MYNLIIKPNKILRKERGKYKKWRHSLEIALGN